MSGLRPPTFNKLDNNYFGFTKPSCNFENNKFDNDLINELIMIKIKEHNIQYAIIAGFCGRLKHRARKKHFCNFETIVP